MATPRAILKGCAGRRNDRGPAPAKSFALTQSPKLWLSCPGRHEDDATTEEKAMKSLNALWIAAGLVLGSSGAYAQQMGNVSTHTATGNVSQASQGQQNENKVNVGNVKLKSGARLGNVSTHTATGNISQVSRGKGNENEVKIGTVE
jgi:hypothetical protein